MAQLGAVARHTVRGDRQALPGLFDPIENRAWAVWNAVRSGPARTTAAKAATGPADKGRAGVAGWELEVNMTRVMRNLWGQEFTRLPSEDQARFASEIRQALSATGNAHCIRQPGLGGGQHDKPLWWIADVWNDVKVVGQFRTIVPTDAERRLSAEEAGETREPAPVEVKKKTPAEESRAESSRRVLEAVHERMRQRVAKEREERMEKILEVLIDAEYPLYNTEVWERTDGVPQSAVESLLREMCDRQMIYRRLETADERRGGKLFGRRHHLYWESEPVPPRDPSLYRPTRTTAQILDGIQPGRHIAIGRFETPGPREVLDDYIRRGLFEIITVDGKQRVRRIPDTPEVVAPVVENVNTPPVFSEVTTVPIPQFEAPELSNSLIQVAGALKELIDAEVKRQLNDTGHDIIAMRNEIRKLRETVERVEGERDAARTELYGMTVRAENAERELEQIRERTREALGL